MPQGSVIANQHEIEPVTPDVRASSLFFVVVNLVLSDPYVLACSRYADWSVMKWPVSIMAPPRSCFPADTRRG
jgi:hypothetical protein